MNKNKDCDGCCYCRIDNHTQEKCQYLINWHCMIKESRSEKNEYLGMDQKLIRK